MTLITSPVRIHFADDLLEEALRAELEGSGSRHALIVVDAGEATAEVEERLLSALPLRGSADVLAAPAETPTETRIASVARRALAAEADHFVAFGGPHALDLAKLVRRAISRAPAGIVRPLTAVPGVAGFASAVADYAALRAGGERRVETHRLFVPSATICDPTLALGAGREAGASALAAALARGAGAVLARGFNPPADALALDAVRRAVRLLPRLGGADTVELRREMMAAGLNSALALRKGRGGLHAVVHGLKGVLPGEADIGALSAILLPGLLARYEPDAPDRAEALSAALGMRSASAGRMADCVGAMVADLPLEQRLGRLGLGEAMVTEAARIALADAAISNGPRRLAAAEVEAMLRDAA